MAMEERERRDLLVRIDGISMILIVWQLCNCLIHMLSGWRKCLFIGFLILLVLATLFMVLSRVISRPG